MTCRELVEFLYAYESHELTPEERAEFDRHLAVCPACIAYLDSYRRTIRLGKAAFAAPDAEVPGEVPRQLVEAILSARKKLRP